MLAMLATSLIALVLLGSALFFAGLLHLRNLEIQETAALAEIVSGYCVGALGRGDAAAAQRALAHVAADRIVEDACLYTTDGRLLARYARLTPPPPPPKVAMPGESFVGDRLELYRHVKQDGVVVGTVYLQTNTWLMWARLKNYFGTGVVVMGITMLVALIFANRLQRFFSNPILELARVAEAVTTQRDFTQRAAKLSEDETGLLTEAFNKMLAIIQEHDSGSRASQSRMEKRIAERTVELRRVNESLRESEARFRAVFEQAMDGFLLADVETKQFSLPNPRMCQMLGYSAEEIEKLSVADIHPGEDLPWVSEIFARQAAGETGLASEVPIRRKDGSVFYADISSRSLEVGGRKCLLGIFRDISERKQAKEVLQRRLETERFVASASSQFANAAAPELDAVINGALAGIGHLMQTDRCFLFSASEDLAIADNTHEWCASGVQSQRQQLRDVPTAAFPWLLERLRDGEPLLLSRTADLPAEAEAERRIWRAGNVQSVVLVPIRHGGEIVGFIGCDVVRAERHWSDEEVRLLRTLGELITNTQARLRASEALRRSEANLHIALDAAELGPWHWNIVTGELFELLWSPQCLALYGLPANTAITYERFLEAVHPDDRESVREALREAVENRSEYMIEKRVVLPDGSVRWTASRGRCAYDEAGQPLRMDGVSYDITERKEVEQALLESEDRYRSLFACSLDAALLATSDGRVLAANPAACRMFGMSEAELILIGRNGIVDLSDPRLKPAVEERNRTGRFYGELTFIRRDGTKFEGEIASVIIPTQTGDDRASVVIRDVTERKRAEAALAKSRSLLLETERIGNVGGWEFHMDTLALTWTEEVYRIHEVDASFKPTVEKGVNFYAPESRPVIEQAVRRAVEQGEPFDMELEIITAKGNRRWVHAIGRADLEQRRVFGFFQDIHSRKRVEEALKALNETLEQRVAKRTAELQQREKELTEAQRVAHIGNWTWDVETGNMTWSDELYRIFGRDPAQFAPHIRSYPQILTAESLARRNAAAQRTIETGTPYELDLEIIRPDGERRWIVSRSEPLRDASGRVVRLRGTAQDITDRKCAEEALRASEEKFRRLATHIQDVLYSVDKETREFRYVSPAFEKVFGYTANDIQNMGGRIEFLRQVVTESATSVDDQRRRLERLASQPEAGVWFRDEEWWRCKDGTLKCIEDRWMPVYESGRLVSTEGLLCDITDRKRAEEALRQSEERYRSLVDNLNVGAYRNTPEAGGHLLQANPAMARMFGFESVDEFLKINVTDTYQNPADRQIFLADLLRAGSVAAYELRLKKKDGTPIYCSVTATAHRGPNGRVEWVDGIVEDITERKRLEDQLIEISEREQRRIGQDLHDGLCQHLAGVGFMSKALAQNLEDAAPTEAADARTVANLIRQAISEARGIATGLHPVKKESNATMVALQELAANIESMFRVHCTFTCDPPVLIKDNNAATHIYRIAQEAVNNALRHGKAKHLWITLAEADHRVTLIVKDDGKGIPQPLPAGRGIGIDIMTHRARVIGGTFHIGCAPEGGTVLTCSFPKPPAT
jgi:PAS domain S-box-containing protein